MPSHLQLLKKCYSITELPILPFLAPTLFEPWPSRCHKFTAGGAHAVRNYSVAVPLDYDNEPRDQQDNWRALDNCCVGDQRQKENFQGEINTYESDLAAGLDWDNSTGSRRRIKPLSQENGRTSWPKSLASGMPVRSMRKSEISATRPGQKSTNATRRNLNASNEFAQVPSIFESDERHRNRISEGKLGSEDIKNELEPQHKLQASHGKERDSRRNYPIRRAQNSRSSLRDKFLIEQPPRPSNISRRIWSEKRFQSRNKAQKEDDMKQWHQLMVSLELLYPGLIDHNRNRKKQIPTVLEFPSDVNELVQLESIDSFKGAWLALPLCRRQAVWPKLMIATLAHHPNKALQILEAIYNPTLPHLYITDILHCIITHHLRKQVCSQDTILDLNSRICKLLLSNLPGEPPELNQTSIYILLQSLQGVTLKEFYLTLVKLKNHLSNDTLIQFASKFAKQGETDLAFDISHKLEGLQESDTARVLSLFTTLLHNSRLNPATQHRESDIFKLLQEFGLTPNIITYNVLMLNAIKDNDFETPWKIHDMMVDTGVEPDEFTYSILLNDAKRRMDLSTMEKVMGLVLKRSLHTTHIFTDILHAIHLLSLVRNGGSSRTSLDFESVFERMVQVFCENFHTELLVKIIPELSGRISPPADPNVSQSLLTPTDATINVMLTGFLYFGQASQAQRWYAHFRDLVASGDPAVEGFMNEPYIYNIILLIYRRHPHLRNEAPQIVADMLAVTETSDDQKTASKSHENAEKIDSLKEGTKGQRSYTPPRPNVCTWTILLQIYMMQGHSRAAEKVLGMMVRRDVKPNLITWNALVAGYSRLQDVDRTADAIRRLEEAGFKPDDNTYKLLGGVGDREALSRALGEKKVVVEPEFMEKLQHDVLTSELEKRMRESHD